MRCLVLSLLAASSVVLLSACGQGGSAFNVGDNTKVDHVLLMSSGQPAGVFKVVPGKTITISAIGVKGGNNTIVTADINYTFDAGAAAANTPFQNAVSGQQGFCAAPPAGLTNAVLAATIFTSANAPSTVSFTAPSSAVAAPPYCINLNAHHTSDGVTGSVVIDVTLSP